jgi:glyoxylase-like metal-dependent hydrolase (beta-lactamase superfamily II)
VTFLLAVVLTLTPGIDLIPGNFTPGSQPDGNTIVVRAKSGLIVFDTGRHVEHTQAIVDYAHEHHQPVVAIINSHWHLDHVGGNAMLRREFPGVKVYASGAYAGARKGFLANYRKQLEEMIAKKPEKTFQDEIALIDAGDALAPDVVIDRSRDVLGLEVNLEKDAVTAGDVWAFDRKSRILLVGDLVTLPVPFFDTACPANWKTSLDRLARVDFETLVPGHGAPMHRNDFETYRTAFDHLVDCKGAKEECINGWMNDAKPLIADADPKFVRAMLDYYVDQKLRGANACK